MHIRFTTHMNIANWYGLNEDKKFVPLAEISQLEPNGDYLLPVEGERRLLQTVASSFGTGYKMKLSTPDRGIRMIDTFDYPGLMGYASANGIDISRVGEPPKPVEEIRYTCNEEEAPKPEPKPEPKPTPNAEPVEVEVIVKELELFPKVEDFLKSQGKLISKAS